MSVLKERYQHIAKESLAPLKLLGFKKKGNTCSFQKGDLTLVVHVEVDSPLYNSDQIYRFGIFWSLWTENQSLRDVYMHMGLNNNKDKAFLVSVAIVPDNYTRGGMRLEDTDPPGFDEDYIAGIKAKIKDEVLPWFDTINSMDDIVHLAEEQLKIERPNRKFFRHTNIYYALVCFYAAKGWKEKFLDMCDQYVEKSIPTARDLAEEKSKKIKKYFDEVWK